MLFLKHMSNKNKHVYDLSIRVEWVFYNWSHASQASDYIIFYTDLNVKRRIAVVYRLKVS